MQCLINPLAPLPGQRVSGRTGSGMTNRLHQPVNRPSRHLSNSAFGQAQATAPAYTCIEQVVRTLLKWLVPGRFVKPTLQLDDVTDISVKWLNANQVKGLIFDLDDTLIKGFCGVVEHPVKNKIIQLRQAGIQCVVLTNNRMPMYCRHAQKQLGIPVLGQARKPSPESFIRALKTLNLNPSDVAVVGDRVLTDVLGATRIGAKSILVRSRNHQHEPWFVRLLRRMERWFLQDDYPPSSNSFGRLLFDFTHIHRRIYIRVTRVCVSLEQF